MAQNYLLAGTQARLPRRSAIREEILPSSIPLHRPTRDISASINSQSLSQHELPPPQHHSHPQLPGTARPNSELEYQHQANLIYHAQFKLIAKMLGDQNMELSQVSSRLEAIFMQNQQHQHLLTQRLTSLERELAKKNYPGAVAVEVSSNEQGEYVRGLEEELERRSKMIEELSDSVRRETFEQAYRGLEEQLTKKSEELAGLQHTQHEQRLKHASQVTALEEQLVRRNQNIQKVTIEVQGLRGRLREQQQQIERVKARQRQLQEIIEQQSKGQYQGMKYGVSALVLQLQNRDEELQKFHRQCEEWQEGAIRKQAEAADLNQHLQTAQNHIRQQNRELESVHQQLKTYQERQHSGAEEIRGLKAELLSYQQHKLETEEYLLRLKSQVESYQQQQQQLRSELLNLQKISVQVSQLRVRNSQTEARLQQAQNEAEARRQETEYLHEMREKRDAQLTHTQQERDELQQHLGKVQTGMGAEVQELRAQVQQRMQLEAHIGELEGQMNELISELEQERAKTGQMHEQLLRMAKFIEEQQLVDQDKQARYGQEIEQMNEAQARVTETAEILREENQKLKAQIDELQSQHRNKGVETEEMRAHLEGDIVILKERIGQEQADLQKQRQKLVEQREQFERQVNKLHEQHHSTVTQLQIEHLEEVNQLKQNVSDEQSDKVRLNTMIGEQSSSITQLQMQIERLQHQMNQAASAPKGNELQACDFNQYEHSQDLRQIQQLRQRVQELERVVDEYNSMDQQLVRLSLSQSQQEYSQSMSGYAIASRELTQQYNTIAILRQQVERLEQKNNKLTEQAASKQINIMNLNSQLKLEKTAKKDTEGIDELRREIKLLRQELGVSRQQMEALRSDLYSSNQKLTIAQQEAINWQEQLQQAQVTHSQALEKLQKGLKAQISERQEDHVLSRLSKKSKGESDVHKQQEDGSKGPSSDGELSRRILNDPSKISGQQSKFIHLGFESSRLHPNSQLRNKDSLHQQMQPNEITQQRHQEEQGSMASSHPHPISNDTSRKDVSSSQRILGTSGQIGSQGLLRTERQDPERRMNNSLTCIKQAQEGSLVPQPREQLAVEEKKEYLPQNSSRKSMEQRNSFVMPTPPPPPPIFNQFSRTNNHVPLYTATINATPQRKEQRSESRSNSQHKINFSYQRSQHSPTSISPLPARHNPHPHRTSLAQTASLPKIQEPSPYLFNMNSQSIINTINRLTGPETSRPGTSMKQQPPPAALTSRQSIGRRESLKPVSGSTSPPPSPITMKTARAPLRNTLTSTISPLSPTAVPLTATNIQQTTTIVRTPSVYVSPPPNAPRASTILSNSPSFGYPIIESKDNLANYDPLAEDSADESGIDILQGLNEAPCCRAQQ